MQVFIEQLSLVLTFAGIAQGPFVVLLLNNRSVRRSRANIFLSILLMVLSFSIAHMLFAGAVINHLSARVYSFGDPTFLLIAPLLWFYTRETTGHPMKWSLSLLLHFLPFFFIITLSLSIRLIADHPVITILDDHSRVIKSIFWLLLVIQFSSYQLLTHKKWNAYRNMLQQEVSNTENVEISWVRFFLMIFLGINVLFFFGLFAAIHLDNGIWLIKTTALIFSLSVFALGYKGILQKEVFQKGETKSLPVTNASAPANKPDQKLVDGLLAYMDAKKPFLDPELTLSSLAKDLNISRSSLSQLINDGIGDNFYDFVNKYRVEEVKRLMIDPEVKNFNLLGLALEAGFKSKSTFNLIFKRFTGLTPTEYKKNISR